MSNYRRKHSSEFKSQVLSAARPFKELFDELFQKKRRKRFNQHKLDDLINYNLYKFWKRQTFNPTWFLKYGTSKGTGFEIEFNRDIRKLKSWVVYTQK